MFWFIASVLAIIPLVKLLPFFGINKYWAALAVVPFGVVALCWWMAIKLQELEKR